MRELLIMTPGPTFVAESVRQAMVKPILNPIVDDSFFDLYLETTRLLQRIMNTQNEVLILCGEGILGLEATCASLTERNDRVLVFSNGIFGEGFGDFVSLYGGDSVLYRSEFTKPFEPEALREFLKKDSDFKYATLVHCETPSGLVNPIDLICPILKEYGILTVVDAVSSIGGIPINPDEWKIDILLGGSQKCLSAPPGLAFLSLSEDAKQMMKNRQQPIIGFYANLTIWDGWYSKKRFPYTQPVSDIFALHEAAKRHVEDDTIWERHKRLAHRVRTEILAMGLELFPESGFSDTVTAIVVPEYMDEKQFKKNLLDKHNVMITGAFASLEGKVLRIGHMGENCYEEKIDQALKCIREELEICRES